MEEGLKFQPCDDSVKDLVTRLRKAFEESIGRTFSSFEPTTYA